MLVVLGLADGGDSFIPRPVAPLPEQLDVLVAARCFDDYEGRLSLEKLGRGPGILCFRKIVRGIGVCTQKTKIM